MRRHLHLLLILFVGCSLCMLCACHHPSNIDEQMPDVVSYNFNIRPILSDKCYKCHGPDASKRQAGLRLDMPESAFKVLKDDPNAHVLVPGSPEMSELFRRVSTNDTTEMMPPASANLKRLTPHEVDLIKKWIKQGAKFEKHWAFVPPKASPVPEVKNKAWPKNTIDYFILNKQEQYGLAPNPEADKERLLKRVSFDLTGLPPDLDLMDRFLADKSPIAYEKVVDELMRSPAYGEKMTLHWLDVARYADSHGYQDDNYRSQWPWRDWVIHAFNENLPYTPDSVSFINGPDSKYSGDGAKMLIDKDLGGNNFGNGKWIASQKDLVIYMQFNKPIDLHAVTLNCMRNMGSQIFLPIGIEIWGGKDAAHLKLLSTVRPPAPKKDDPFIVKGMDCKLTGSGKLSCLKIIAQPIQNLPVWDPVKKQPGWVFMDEIFLN